MRDESRIFYDLLPFIQSIFLHGCAASRRVTPHHTDYLWSDRKKALSHSGRFLILWFLSGPRRLKHSVSCIYRLLRPPGGNNEAEANWAPWKPAKKAQLRNSQASLIYNEAKMTIVSFLECLLSLGRVGKRAFYLEMEETPDAKQKPVMTLWPVTLYSFFFMAFYFYFFLETGHHFLVLSSSSLDMLLY